MKIYAYMIVFMLLFTSALADTTETQVMAPGDNVEITIIVVEMSESRGDMNSTEITKTASTENDDVLQEISLVLPTLNTPAGTAATLSGVLKIGDDIWTFINESVVRIGSGRLVVDTKILTQDTKLCTEKLVSKEPYDTVTIVGVVQFPVIEFIEIGVDISATPTIKEGNIVNLSSTIKISEVMREAPEERQTTVPVTSSRDIVTNVDLVVGQLSVLGEMNMKKRLDMKSGIPFLRNIPIFGNFIFSTTEIQYVQTRLCIVAGVKSENKEAMERYKYLFEENETRIDKKFPFK